MSNELQEEEYEVSASMKYLNQLKAEIEKYKKLYEEACEEYDTALQREEGAALKVKHLASENRHLRTKLEQEQSRGRHLNESRRWKQLEIDDLRLFEETLRGYKDGPAQIISDDYEASSEKCDVVERNMFTMESNRICCSVDTAQNNDIEMKAFETNENLNMFLNDTSNKKQKGGECLVNNLDTLTKEKVEADVSLSKKPCETDVSVTPVEMSVEGPTMPVGIYGGDDVEDRNPEDAEAHLSEHRSSINSARNVHVSVKLHNTQNNTSPVQNIVQEVSCSSSVAMKEIHELRTKGHTTLEERLRLSDAAYKRLASERTKCFVASNI